MSKKKLYSVVLVGRANVGKSTLFNALYEQRKALVSPIAGTTRDMNFCHVDWKDTSFELIDTGGFDIDPSNTIEEAVIKQGKRAMKQADMIVFVLDGKHGILKPDNEFAKELRRQQKPVTIVVNKMDNPALRSTLPEYYSLGFESVFGVSAVNGSGLGDFLDYVYEHISEKRTLQQKGQISIAIIGKPNVGKSSLLNILLGEQRAIVSEIAHTTRSSNDAFFTYDNTTFRIVDTAGIRRKSKANADLEKLSVMQSLEAIKSCDIALLMIEVNKGIESMDKRLIQLVEEQNKGLIVIGNKWDLVEDKKTKSAKDFEKKIRLDFPKYAPVILISAKTGQHTDKLLKTAREIFFERSKQIPREELSALLKTLKYKKAKPSVAANKQYAKLYGMKQIDKHPPVFAVVTRSRDVVAQGYLNRIEKAIRKKYGFKGTPIKIITMPLLSR